ncbi:Plasmodium exported protein (PHISTa-like), unknown function [Plasmodium reichenowi]|uniref:Plasmodium RESA N-terminal domain-containing protein n=1 Tax=Plasmodium reichenowi TaxID=5854 RepID=A0A2P9DMD1_PLARE|nr:Plasmodium exported protein (PHISTa-like), unknown function [Plasmodium reichenowi]
MYSADENKKGKLHYDNKYRTNNDFENGNLGNKSNSSISNVNYNDISKQLRRQELIDILYSFNECPSNSYLFKLWEHTFGVHNERISTLLNEFMKRFPKYLTDFKFMICKDDDDVRNTSIWLCCANEFGRVSSINDMKFTKEIHELKNNKYSFDDIRNFIFSCLKDYEQIYNEIYNEY